MLKIFNTLSRKKEIFVPINLNKIKIYVCGVTTSNYCHVGHGRTFYFFDILLRYLIFLKYNCIYVRNITDIDDKIINKSNIDNINVYDLSNLMIRSMLKDFNNLNFKKPNYEPKLTDNIDLIISAIIKLIKYDYAYVSDTGDILFSINKVDLYKSYFFNNRDISNKLNNQDFVLWKLNKLNDFLGWCSPWGFGRPGWHIGCSVMSNKYLFGAIDIHGGGYDLQFPHHHNELIQSQCLFKSEYLIKYWVHTGMVILNKNKMSKSKSNVFFLKNLFNKYHIDVIKYYLMSTHYRKNLFFDVNSLNKTRLVITKFYLLLKDLNLNISLSKQDYLALKYFDDEFIKFMNDDFNIPKVYNLLFLIFHEINKFKNKNFILASKLGVKMRFLANIIGLLNFDIYSFLNKKVGFKKLSNNLLVKKINKLIYLRNIARKSNNWIKADFIKKKLFNLNVKIKDKNNYCTEWYFNS